MQSVQGGGVLDEFRILEAAVRIRDEELLLQALNGSEVVQFAERLLAAARGTLAPMQHARQNLDSTLGSVTEDAQTQTPKRCEVP